MSDHAAKFQQLAEKARQLPKQPGVYLMKDASGVVLYVGKASNLPDRVASYFQPSTDLGPKKQRMLGQIEDFDVVECEGEWEALLTENRLIKDLHPHFNARLTDDKTFPYLVITMKEDFPGVYLTREPNHPRFKGAKILGPFTTVYAVKESLKLLQGVFKFRTCELEIEEGDDSRRFFRPCLLHPINKCSAPCAAKISKEAYRADIDRFVRFLESKRSSMLRQLRKEMEQASREMRYEEAAKLRDQIHAIEKLDERGRRSAGWQPETESFLEDPSKGQRSLQNALGLDRDIRCVECFDIAHLQGEQTVGSKVCFVDGRPLKQQYRRYKVRTSTNDDYMALREVVSRAYREAGMGQELYPDLIIVDGGPGQLSAAMEGLGEYEHQPPAIVSLAKKEELIHVPDRSEPIRLGRTNPGLKLAQHLRDEAHRFAQHYHHILRRKKVLDEQ